MVIDLAMQIKDEIKHLITKNAELQDRVDELTAERDKLQAAIDAMENGQFYAMYRAKCDECERLKEKQEKGGKHDDG